MTCTCGGDLVHGWHDAACVEGQVEEAEESGLRAALEAVRENWRKGNPVTPIEAIERPLEDAGEERGGA